MAPVIELDHLVVRLGGRTVLDGVHGALSGRAMEVVKCETVVLNVPATAEVVIEGHVSITRDATGRPSSWLGRNRHWRTASVASRCGC